ncbi:cytochrome c [Robbsia sp. Bb-Pol-6]|uniref:Cytochrome c n=1 Tax=Robbsia betulipollinis TaxID=2981849 RepID=A0ABT3ZT24_9BURK|nr:cytochrome c [Robbsia betulipollinis]MCY0389691.1 cytochrome c [Robbsia betulipollinis]
MKHKTTMGSRASVVGGALLGMLLAVSAAGAATDAAPASAAAASAAAASAAASSASTPTPAAAASGDQAAVARGAYLARAGDCIACHTAVHGKPFAGGLAIESPLGTIWSTNITPDAQNGIGAYTEAQFGAALREGKRADGSNLYPAMPYPSYSKLTDADVHDLYVYFMKGVAPVALKPTPTRLHFPFNMRFGLGMWDWAFMHPGVFQPDPARSAEVNRGAYLVEGLGHCGSCHTARGIAMQEKALDDGSAGYLGGTNLNDWWAPQLRGDAGGAASGGVASWSTDEIVDYLGSGRNVHGAVNGEMTAVVQNSTSHMTPADRHAIAAYLKSLKVDTATATPAVDAAAREATRKTLTAATSLTLGQRLYLDNCAGCHTVTGNGAPRVFPATAGNSLINAQDPTGLIRTILGGAVTPSTPLGPEHLPMPGFAYRLSDDEAAQLATFVRAGWGNRGGAVTAAQVAKVRATLPARQGGDAQRHAAQKSTGE